MCYIRLWIVCCYKVCIIYVYCLYCVCLYVCIVCMFIHVSLVHSECLPTLCWVLMFHCCTCLNVCVYILFYMCMLSISTCHRQHTLHIYLHTSFSHSSQLTHSHITLTTALTLNKHSHTLSCYTFTSDKQSKPGCYSMKNADSASLAPDRTDEGSSDASEIGDKYCRRRH